MRVEWYQGTKPVKVEWKPNQLGNLDLIINDVKQPVEIVLAASKIGKSEILCKLNGVTNCTSTRYKLGMFKKRILANMYHINFKYVED